MFNKQNFCHIASNNRNEVKVGVFVYKTTDNLATVTTSGYFNEKIVDINLHDLIIHEWHDPTDRTKVQRNVLCVTERTLDNVGTQIIKTDWEEQTDETLEQLATDISGKVSKSGDTMTGALEFSNSQGSDIGITKHDSNSLKIYKKTNADLEAVNLEFVDANRLDVYPTQNNVMSLGALANKLKTVYTGQINNGSNLAVPNPGQADTIALKSEVDLAANSGDQLTNKGVWYAKMYAATVAPVAEDSTNYADFSQTDGQGNPIIVLYERQNGAWVQTDTITPPADYNGYVTVTSKIWDIVEQAGQQGGKVLWSHNTKTFTPYPQIISFEDIHVTGDSTVVIPANPGNNQIVNKDYVDNAISSIPSSAFDLFDTKWRDATTSNSAWALSDGNWKTSATALAHLSDDYNNISTATVNYVFDQNDPDVRYYRDADKDSSGSDHPYAFTSFLATNVVTVYGSGSAYFDGPESTATQLFIDTGSRSEVIRVPSTETIAGTTIAYYTAADGHKICLANQETNVNAVYTSTGVAWYYILDEANNQFKLPRSKFAFVGSRGNVGNYVAPGLPNITGAWNDRIAFYSAHTASGAVVAGTTGDGAEANVSGTSYPASYSFDASKSNSIYGASTTVQAPATQMYLYFYIG